MRESFDTFDDAVRVARAVLDGTREPQLGRGLIAGIATTINHPAGLMEFVHIAHLLDDAGHPQFTAADCLPDILAACRALVATATPTR